MPPVCDTRRMTEEHQLVDALRQGIERKDADAIAELLHPDVELRLYSSQAPITGREAARAWYAESFGRGSDSRATRSRSCSPTARCC